MIATMDHTAVSPDTLLPDLLHQYPHARAVLDRYGLRGCGGRFGPIESVGFFARAHGVDERQLLAELADAAASSSPVPAYAPEVADSIYRRYFLAAIIITLTLGASWGLWLLWQIGFAGSFTGASIQQINAHGHAQIFGWVGLFIMGFAYQAFPRFWHTELPAPRLAVGVFALMVVGVAVRTLAMTLGGVTRAAVPAVLVGGGLEIIAIVLFTAQMIVTFRRAKIRLEPYVGFIFAALVWFVAMSIMGVWHTVMTMTAANAGQLLWQVSTYQAPLRDLQIHGLALFMILGVSIRILPPLFGLSPVPDRRAWRALVILSAAVVAEVGIFVIYRWSGNHWIAALLMIPWLMLAIGSGLIALPWRLWRPTPRPDRSGKFIRIAYAWLGLSLVMLLLLPVYQAVSHIPFSHAYYGAIRHAVTVGFISMMILGVAAKVVPTLNGVDTHRLSALWGPFLLVNSGCFLRVSLQTLTDWNALFYHLVGISGVLEIIGLTWWGLHLAFIMRQGKRNAHEEQADGCSACSDITLGTRVSEILDRYPATMEVFDRFGFAPLRQPLLRRTVARAVTLGQAAAMHQACPDTLLNELRHAAGLTPLAGPVTPECHPPASCTHDRQRQENETSNKT